MPARIPAGSFKLGLYVVGLVGLILFSGCTLGPDYRREQALIHESDGYVNAPETLAAAIDADACRWWERMDDAAMTSYVNTLLAQTSGCAKPD